MRRPECYARTMRDVVDSGVYVTAGLRRNDRARCRSVVRLWVMGVEVDLWGLGRQADPGRRVLLEGCEMRCRLFDVGRAASAMRCPSLVDLVPGHSRREIPMRWKNVRALRRRTLNSDRAARQGRRLETSSWQRYRTLYLPCFLSMTKTPRLSLAQSWTLGVHSAALCQPTSQDVLCTLLLHVLLRSCCRHRATIELLFLWRARGDCVPSVGLTRSIFAGDSAEGDLDSEYSAVLFYGA